MSSKGRISVSVSVPEVGPDDHEIDDEELGDGLRNIDKDEEDPDTDGDGVHSPDRKITATATATNTTTNITDEDYVEDMDEAALEMELAEDPNDGELNTGLTLEENDDAGMKANDTSSLTPTDADRNQFGINSPKKTPTSCPTPLTQFRNDAGINSPKQPKNMDWSVTQSDESKELDSEGDVPAGLAALVTQVPQAGSHIQDIPETGEEDSVDASIQEAKKPKSGGLCACFSCLFFCCGPSPSRQATHIVNSNSQGNETVDDDDNVAGAPPSTQQNQHYSNHDTQQHSSNTYQKPNTRPKAGTSESISHSTSSNRQRSDSLSLTTEYPTATLLPPMDPDHVGKKCLVLDLDETLVHSSFKPVPNPDFIIPVEIDNVTHKVYVLKRPFVDDYLASAANDYEIVVFTASLAKYADPLLDQLDPHRYVRHRLFREHCVLHGTAYVKDLRKLGRRLKDTIIVDNSPQSYLFQPKNAIPIASWYDDRTDTQLYDLIGTQETTLKNVSDVRWVLDAHSKPYKWLCEQANKPLEIYNPANNNMPQ